MLLFLAGWLALAQAATVRVSAGQPLQAAIDAAHPGDVLEIERATYTGNFVVNRALTLRGLDRPTLSGGQRGDTVRVSAPDVVIEGLIVRDSGDSLKDQNAASTSCRARTGPWCAIAI